MPELKAAGRAWVFGDNIDTDTLAPGPYLKLPVEEMAQHCLEAVDPEFAPNVQPGDIVVGGANFGLGSSREQAAACLKQLGVGAVVAKSFARIFFRNALNLALPVLICPKADTISAGDELQVDAVAGRVLNKRAGETLTCEAIPPHLVQMIEDGGLLPHLKKKLKGRAA